MTKIALRPYQRAATDGAIEALNRVRSTLVVSPTGTGKTIIMGAVAQHAQRHGMHVLVIAHRRELLRQAAKAFHLFGLAELHADRSGHVIASVQTMQGSRLRSFDRDAFGLVIVDEAHHACAKTYRNVISHFRSARILGVTATPDRGDGVELRTVFDEVAFEYAIKDAIKDGWLSPIRTRRIVVEGLDLKSVKLKGRRRDSAFNEKALSKVLQRDEALHGMAHPIIAEAGGRSTLVFCADVEHAHAMADVLRRHAGADAALALDGSASEDERQRAIKRFRDGDLQFLCNCMLFLEGFDAPRTSCVAMTRPWRVRAPYVQAVGRGTRLFEGKSDVLVLDFVGNSDDHTLICPADILEGKKLTEEERKAVSDVLKEDPDIDIVEALTEADRRMRANITVKARYRAFDSDPFIALDVERPREDPEWAKAPTPAQLGTWAIQSLGKAGEGLTRREASTLIDAMMRRSRAGAPSYKQARLLAKFGFDPAGIAKAEAGRLITAIKENGWRRPDGLEPRITQVTPPQTNGDRHADHG